MFPVLALEGISHASFMDSTMLPAFVKTNDLKAEVSEDEGHKEIAEGFVGLIEQVVKSASFDNGNTKTVLQPLMDAMILEGSYTMKDPCYAHDLLNPTDDPKCLPGSPWVANTA